MSARKSLFAACAALGLCGCQSMAVMAIKTFDEKPYSLPVTARELTEASSIASALEAGAETPAPASGGPATVQALPRTEVVGKGDGSMTDDRVVVTARAKDIPHRAPDFSREQAAAMVCSARLWGGGEGKVKAALRAYDATMAAYDARLAYEAGKLTLKQTDAAELKRQEAVKAIINGGLLFGLAGGATKKADLPKLQQAGLTLEDVDLFTFTEAGKPVMAVSGVVRNTTEARVDVSPLTLQALDRWEFILAGQTSLLPFETVEAGEARTFEVRFHNPPDTTYEVYAHFAPPFEYRARRECDLSDPAVARMLAPHTAEQAAALTAPMHTPAELNQLMRAYRAEAESAWGQRMCGNPEEVAKAKAKQEEQSKTKSKMKIGAEGAGERRGGMSISIGMSIKADLDRMCAAWGRRAPWRDMFALAEATDEAWGAMLAAAELRRLEAKGNAVRGETEAAEAASRASYATFREMGAKMLSRAGAQASDVTVTIASSDFGYEPFSKVFDGGDPLQIGFYVDVRGEVRNIGTAPQRISALMLALVDRLEQPLLTYRIEEAAALAPGEAKTFNHRVFMTDPIERKSSKDTPPWQVRVGAIGE